MPESNSRSTLYIRIDVYAQSIYKLNLCLNYIPENLTHSFVYMGDFLFSFNCNVASVSSLKSLFLQY
jgi:hypothetical protein